MNARELIEATYGVPSTLYRKPANPEAEHVVAAAVKSRMTGDVFRGDDHTHAFEVAGQHGVEISYGSAILGFWTSGDRFVSRDEALSIAQAQRQASGRRSDVLHSLHAVTPEGEQKIRSRWKGEAQTVQPFPGSKVQQLVHHGTGQKFRRFKRGTQGIIWFASSPEPILAREVGAQGHGYIVSAYINVQNPAGWKAYDNLLLAQFKGEGLDGAVLPNRHGFDAFVFDPDQVRIVEVKPL